MSQVFWHFLSSGLYSSLQPLRSQPLPVINKVTKEEHSWAEQASGSDSSQLFHSTSLGFITQQLNLKLDGPNDTFIPAKSRGFFFILPDKDLT